MKKFKKIVACVAVVAILATGSVVVKHSHDLAEGSTISVYSVVDPGGGGGGHKTTY